MQILAWIGSGLFCAASVVMGARLLRLWLRTRAAPEGLAAAALLGIGPLGFGTAVASPWLVPLSPLLANGTWAAGAAALGVGGAAVFGFTWRVFRPDAALAQIAVWVAAGMFAGLWLAEAGTHGFLAGQPAGPAVRVADALRTAGLLWGSCEALTYQARLRRRVRLGLGHADALYRIQRWAVALGAAAIASGVDVAVKGLLGTATSEIPGVLLLDAACGSLAAISLWAAFRPGPAAAREAEVRTA